MTLITTVWYLLIISTQMKLEPRGPFIVNKFKNINPDIKIVFLSGDKSRSAVKSWLDIAVDYFIYKLVKTDVIITPTDPLTHELGLIFSWPEMFVTR